jgi:hypothetical protein
MRIFTLITAYIVFVGSIMHSTPAYSALELEVSEVNGGVHFALSGTLDLDRSQGRPLQTIALPLINPSLGIISAGENIDQYNDVRRFEITGPRRFGPGRSRQIFDATGDLFLLRAGVDPSESSVSFAQEYAGGPFATSWFFSNSDLSSLGLWRNSLRWDFVDSPGDTNFITYNPVAIPLPATAPMLLAGIAGLAAVRGFRRKSLEIA